MDELRQLRDDVAQRGVALTEAQREQADRILRLMENQLESEESDEPDEPGNPIRQLQGGGNPNPPPQDPPRGTDPEPKPLIMRLKGG